MKGMKIKETYLLFLIVMGLVSLGIYTTYALFTASTEIEDVVGFDATLSTNNNIVEYEMLTVPAGESKLIELNITNSYTDTLYYGAWYEVVSPSTKNDNILIGVYTDWDNTLGTGTIDADTTIDLIVGVTNNTSSDIIVNIGTVGSLTSSLGLANTRTLITERWTGEVDEDAIIVTDEYLEANKVWGTIPFVTEYTTPGMTEVTLNPGTNKLEVWGAQGGSYNSTYVGGLGGYSYGTLTLDEATTAYVYVGGQAATNTTDRVVVTGGINGGGNGANRYYSSTYTYGQGGGGASDIRIGQDSLYARVIVAGGGSGSTNRTNGYYGGGETSGTGQSGYSATQIKAGTNGSFGTGGSATTSGLNYKYGSAGGGGGWYGGGASSSRSDSTNYDKYTGGGSGWVYTESSFNTWQSGNSSNAANWLLNSSYYLTEAATIGDGTTTFTDFDGSSVTGHSGNGAVRITGTTEGYTYTVPRVLGLTDLSIDVGDSIDLTEGVTLECETGQTGCSLIGPEITNTSSLSVGAHTIYYNVIGSDNKKYKFPRNVTVTPKASLVVTNISVNNTTFQGIPQTGLYSLTSNNCNNVTYDRFTKKVKISDFTTPQKCDLNFTTDTNYPFLNTMQVGDYVAYVGNKNCNNGVAGTTGTGAAESGNSCKGYNANQPTDGTEDSKGRYGYCNDDNYHYTTYGWRIAYIEDNKVHLISAGSPECRTRTSSTNNATAITDLNTAALDYCNSTYVDGGTCPTTASETNAVRALGNTDFEKITYAISGTTSSLTSVYGSTICYNLYSYKRCGYGNDLLDNGGYYWFAAHNNSTNGVRWYPYNRGVASSSGTGAYGFRPIIRLSSLVYVTGGSGTMDDPYTIGI